jgi:hypothetical protein
MPTGLPTGDVDSGIGLDHGPPRGPTSPHSDPLLRAIAHCVEALHRRYPEGPAQMRREGLDGRANITAMHTPKKGTAA